MCGRVPGEIPGPCFAARRVRKEAVPETARSRRAGRRADSPYQGEMSRRDKRGRDAVSEAD